MQEDNRDSFYTYKNLHTIERLQLCLAVSRPIIEPNG